MVVGEFFFYGPGCYDVVDIRTPQTSLSLMPFMRFQISEFVETFFVSLRWMVTNFPDRLRLLLGDPRSDMSSYAEQCVRTPTPVGLFS